MSSSSPPGFIIHICTVLHLSGLRGFNGTILTPEHFRLAKKDDPSVASLFWCVLHDLIALMELPHLIGNDTRLKAAWKKCYSNILTEADVLKHCENICQPKLYKMGYTHLGFFQHNVAARDILLAISWCLVRGDFFAKVRKMKESKFSKLIPLPEDTPLTLKQTRQARSNATSGILKNHILNKSTLCDAIQCRYGQLSAKNKELKVWMKCYDKYKAQILLARPSLSPFKVHLARDSDQAQMLVGTIEARIKDRENEGLFFKWIGGVFNESKREAASFSKTLCTSEKDEREGLIESAELISLLKARQQVTEALSERLELRKTVSAEWAKRKSALGDAEYRRQKHRLQKLGEKVDQGLLGVFDAYKSTKRISVSSSESLAPKTNKNGAASVETCTYDEDDMNENYENTIKVVDKMMKNMKLRGLDVL